MPPPILKVSPHLSEPGLEISSRTPLEVCLQVILNPVKLRILTLTIIFYFDLTAVWGMLVTWRRKKKKRKRYPNYSTTVLEPVSQWVADIKLRDEFLIFCYLEKGTEVTSLRNPEYLGRIQFSTFAHFFLHIAYRHKRWVASCWRSPSELSRSHRSLLSHDSSCSSPPHPDFIFSCATSTN